VPLRPTQIPHDSEVGSNLGQPWDEAATNRLNCVARPRRRVVWYIGTNVQKKKKHPPPSSEHTSIKILLRYVRRVVWYTGTVLVNTQRNVGSNMVIWIVDNYLPDYTASLPRKPQLFTRTILRACHLLYQGYTIEHMLHGSYTRLKYHRCIPSSVSECLNQYLRNLVCTCISCHLSPS
jgi:hypothetical protein